MRFGSIADNGRVFLLWRQLKQKLQTITNLNIMKNSETKNIQSHSRNTLLGEVFKLPFGDKIVMSHWVKDSVYIEGVFGEPKSTFIDAYDKLTEAIKYGAVLPPKIKVICACKLEFEGSYLELEKIVGQLKNFA